MNYEELKQGFKEIIEQKNSEYNASFNKAREQVVRLEVEKFVKANPELKGVELTEAVNNFVKEYLAETPDEFQRSLRLNANIFGTLFNTLNHLITVIADFRDLYIATNKETIEKVAKDYEEQLKEE